MLQSSNSRLSDLWFAIRMPFVWRWRCGYWDWEAIALCWRFVFARRVDRTGAKP